MTIKTIHLEIALELSTDAFLAAIDRFVANVAYRRRYTPIVQ